jgi:hypothetical protein
VAIVCVLGLTIRPAWTRYLRALSLVAVSYGLVVLLGGGDGHLAARYAPHPGGGDGMTHDDSGRTMAMLAATGRLGEALEGGEPVYWNTPGLRYVRMVEKLVFGDTNHLLTLLAAAVPVLLFLVMRRFVPVRVAWLLALLFWLLPMGEQYLSNVMSGYGDTIAVVCFLLGLVLMLRTQPAWGGTNDNHAFVWIAGAALAASMFIRPNFAFAVVWMGAAWAWASWRRHDVTAVAALALGLGLALWMPFHNWYYGGELYLISKSGTLVVPLGAGDYLLAAGDILQGQLRTARTAAVAAQFRGWLADPGPLFFESSPLAGSILYAAHLLGLGLAGWTAAQWLTRGAAKRPALSVIAVAALLAHAPMLFIFDTDYRYAMLGWLLSLIVLAGWFGEGWRRSERAALDGVPAHHRTQGDRPVPVGHAS